MTGSPGVVSMTRSVRDFTDLMNKHHGERLPDWMLPVQADNLPALHSLVTACAATWTRSPQAAEAVLRRGARVVPNPRGYTSAGCSRWPRLPGTHELLVESDAVSGSPERQAPRNRPVWVCTGRRR